MENSYCIRSSVFGQVSMTNGKVGSNRAALLVDMQSRLSEVETWEASKSVLQLGRHMSASRSMEFLRPAMTIEICSIDVTSASGRRQC